MVTVVMMGEMNLDDWNEKTRRRTITMRLTKVEQN